MSRENNIYKVHEHSTEFSKETDETDLVLLLADAKLYVNRAVLVLASPVFKAMLTKDAMEKNEHKIQLHEKKSFQIITFLRCIYPNTLDSVTSSNVDIVLPLADEYQCTELKKKCELCLLDDLTRDTSIQNTMRRALAAEKRALPSLLNRCIEVLSYKKLSVLQNVWENITTESKVRITVKRIEQLEGFCKTVATKSSQSNTYFESNNHLYFQNN